MTATSSDGKITCASLKLKLSRLQVPSSVIFSYLAGSIFIAPIGPVTRHSSAIIAFAALASLSTIDCQKRFSSARMVSPSAAIAGPPFVVTQGRTPAGCGGSRATSVLVVLVGGRGEVEEALGVGL